jgi:hypothetical protein
MYMVGAGLFLKKLKMLKAALIEWHATHSKNMPGRIVSLKERPSVLDVKGEEEGLSKEESSRASWCYL